jgi:hypothetical protein
VRWRLFSVRRALSVSVMAEDLTVDLSIKKASQPADVFHSKIITVVWAGSLRDLRVNRPVGLLWDNIVIAIFIASFGNRSRLPLSGGYLGPQP